MAGSKGRADHRGVASKAQAALAVVENTVPVDPAGHIAAASRDPVGQEADMRLAAHRAVATDQLAALAALVDRREDSWAWLAAHQMAMRRTARWAVLASCRQKE